MPLLEICHKFPAQDDCIAHLERIRWDGNPVCPYCASTKPTIITHERRYHCNVCNTTYSVTVGTLFHHTRIPLEKWFISIRQFIVKNGKVSSRELAEDIKVNRNTAWRIIVKIREAFLQPSQRELLIKLFQ